ncbi:MAG: hypothetical protein VZS44_10555 [Bacilli bacterium]|nr:hypothetical protein [Bacilli bacterium]
MNNKVYLIKTTNKVIKVNITKTMSMFFNPKLYISIEELDKHFHIIRQKEILNENR